MHGGRRRFHIPPCHAEPAAREVVLKSAGWRGGGFPAHEKCPAPARRAGHFRVRLSGRYNALYLAAQKAARRAPGDTPGPFCGFGLEYSGPWQAPPCSALCRRFCRRWTGGGAGTRPGGKNPPAGWLRGTWGWRRGQYEAAQKTVTRVTALRIVRSGSLLPATQVPVLRSKTEEGTGSIMAETLLAGATSSLP